MLSDPKINFVCVLMQLIQIINPDNMSMVIDAISHTRATCKIGPGNGKAYVPLGKEEPIPSGFPEWL